MEAPNPRNAFVLGGSSHVGQAVVRALSAAGAQVGFSYFRSDGPAEALAKETSARPFRLDLTDVAAITQTLAGFAREAGPLTALVHSAALPSASEPPTFESLTGASEAGFDRLFAVNVKSAFFAVAAALPHFAPAGGNVVFVGSVDGVKAVPSSPAFAASKGALSALARSLAKELGPKQLRVNVVAPGILEGGSSSAVPEHVRREYLKHACARRYGTFDEIAQSVRYFALDNTYVTGQTLVLDGGL